MGTRCAIYFKDTLTATSRYNQIRTIQVNHLLNVWLSGDEKRSRAVREELEKKIDSYAAGELEHAVDAMSSIWEISNKEGPVSSVPVQHPDEAWFPFWFSRGYWDHKEDEIRPLLIKSIKEGHLFDRKYWGRRSRGGGIEPIYFSDAVIRAELSCLNSGELLHLEGC